jgi:hypothetical protein
MVDPAAIRCPIPPGKINALQKTEIGDITDGKIKTLRAEPGVLGQRYYGYYATEKKWQRFFHNTKIVKQRQRSITITKRKGEKPSFFPLCFISALTISEFVEYLGILLVLRTHR